MQRSGPGDSIVRKLYALLAQAHRRLGQPGEALAACRAGRARHPDDAELLSAEGTLLEAHGDSAGAEACWRQALAPPAGRHFGSADEGLRGPKTRHRLALLYRAQGRGTEALAEWRQAVAAQPDFGPAWLGLAELYLTRADWAAFEPALARAERLPGLALDAALLRARGLLTRKEFAAARRLMDELSAGFPEALGPLVLRTHTLL